MRGRLLPHEKKKGDCEAALFLLCLVPKQIPKLNPAIF